MGVIVVVCVASHLIVSEAKTEIMYLRTKGMPEATAIFKRKGSRPGVCMYVWPSHIAEYRSTG